MFFESWDNLIRVLLVGALAYAGLIVLLRVSGNRTLSKMNSFDFVVTIALGSTFSAILINKNVTLSQGLMALALLVGLQFMVTWLSYRSRTVSKTLKTTPTLLLRDGQLLDEAMKRVRVTEEEVRSAVRQKGWGELEQISAVIMETDGTLSVISKPQSGSLSALKSINGDRKSVV